MDPNDAVDSNSNSSDDGSSSDGSDVDEDRIVSWFAHTGTRAPDEVML